MPRIDPLQLLRCLSVLLSPNGGILSKDEVPRLVNLMTKFSKKLVSKCVYVLILKVTDIELVDMFMAEGGWTLVETLLQDAIHMSNWALVKEILGLLLITPVSVDRLKLNNIPKLVKSLSRREDLPEVHQLSNEIVEKWLALVKSNQVAKVEPVPTPVTISETQLNEVTGKLDVAVTVSAPPVDVQNVEEAPKTEEVMEENKIVIEKEETTEAKEEAKVQPTEEKKSSSSSSSRSSSSSSRRRSSGSSKSSSSSSRDKSRDKDRDRSKDKRDKDRDRHRSNGSSKHSSSSSSSRSSSSSKDKDRKSSKESSKDKDKTNQAEKDKDTLAKIKPQSLDKMGKIPKKSSDDKSKDVKKKPTMSIEVRKNKEDRPKTVKVFNSKMRSTGLEEEVKPPPLRPTKKPSVQLPTIPQKRPSPPKDSITALITPPEKKFKLDNILDKLERPGAIKLIPPKPKPTVLQESDIFMDAVTAAITKKEPKKRKRRPSVTKETPSSPSTATETATTPSSPLASPLGLKNIAPINFYQDTLNAESGETEGDKKEEKDEAEKDGSGTPTETEEEGGGDCKRGRITEDGLKGVLCFTKRKGPKRSIKWKSDDDLVEVRYFELDETERVNVTKTFMDMAKMEMCGEREAVMLSRKLPNEDIMGQQTMWRVPHIIDQPDPLVVPGFKSLEKDIQFAREKNVLQALYFDKRRIPDSPFEPDPETHQMKDPIIIPLEDPDANENDMRNTPWPEPKGSPPHVDNNTIQPPIFQNMPGAFNPPFQQMPPPAFQGMPPRFGGPGGPNNFMPPNMMPNGNMLGPHNMGPPPDMMNQGPLNPNMFGPGPPGPDNFNSNDNPNFPMPFNQPNMFPPNNFNMGRGGGPNRGGFRGRGGNGPWIRMNGPGPNNWNRGGGGGGGHRGGRLCKNVKNHGYCRNRDNCPFVHPN